jgi:hypothetical protein
MRLADLQDHIFYRICSLTDLQDPIFYRIYPLADLQDYISYRICPLADLQDYISYRICLLADLQDHISYRIFPLADLKDHKYYGEVVSRKTTVRISKTLKVLNYLLAAFTSMRILYPHMINAHQHLLKNLLNRRDIFKSNIAIITGCIKKHYSYFYTITNCTYDNRKN